MNVTYKASKNTQSGFLVSFFSRTVDVGKLSLILLLFLLTAEVKVNSGEK